ncbi:MAG: DUF504 domain-containing protein [Methanomicrobiales archaeon]|nr:DUF504 domain-containing protein [Methanomicrobiales archaeon]
MRTSHALLLKFRYDPRCDFNQVIVTYIDRGAAGDRTSVKGADITGLGPWSFTILSLRGETEVPYHRIVEITYRGEVRWRRP